jgi:hypothetical protein
MIVDHKDMIVDHKDWKSHGCGCRCLHYYPHMGPSPAFSRRCRSMWALPEPSAVFLWQLGIASSSAAAVVDAWTGRRIVLSGFVLIGPYCVALTGRWLRTAVAGAWAICLVVVLAIPDGIWGTRLETSLIGFAIFVAVSSTLMLLITFRTVLSLSVTGFLAACGSHAPSAGRPDVSPARPASCRQQYETWQHSPAQAQVSKLAPALRTIQVAGESGDVSSLATGMKSLVPAAMVLADHPMPHCADPAGLYAEFVNRIYAAGSHARSAQGLSGLLRAAAPVKGLKAIESGLTAEVHRALAKN